MDSSNEGVTVVVCEALSARSLVGPSPISTAAGGLGWGRATRYYGGSKSVDRKQRKRASAKDLKSAVVVAVVEPLSQPRAGCCGGVGVVVAHTAWS